MAHKAIPGIPLVVKAGEYNAAIEAGQWFAQSQQLGSPRTRQLGGVNPCAIKVRNDSGADCAAGEVLAIGDTVLTAPEKRSLWFAGDTPTSGQSYAVLLEPIPDGEIGLAQVVGVCLASVDIGDADHEWAHVEDGATTLASDFGGTAKILWKPSGTGVKECVVELGITSGPVRAVADEDIAAGGNGAVSVYTSGDIGTIETAYNDWADSADIAEFDEVIGEWYDADGKWRIRPRASGLPTCTLYQFEGYKDTGVSTGTTLAWSDTVKIACFPQRSLGDVSGCGLSIVTSPGAYTDYAFKTTTGGLYLIQFIAHPIDNTSYGGLYVTRTDSGGDTVNVPHGYWSTRTTIRVQYRASGGGEGDWIDAAYANGPPYILPSDGMTQYPRYAAVFASGIASIDADSEFCVRMLSSLLAQTGGSGQPTASACVFNAGNTVDTMNVRITRLGDTETEVSY